MRFITLIMMARSLVDMMRASIDVSLNFLPRMVREYYELMYRRAMGVRMGLRTLDELPTPKVNNTRLQIRKPATKVPEKSGTFS